MNIELGIYPLAGIIVAAVLYAVFRFTLRMRVTPRVSQWFIVVSVVLSLGATFVTPVKTIQEQTLPQPLPREGSRMIEHSNIPQAAQEEVVTTPLSTREGLGGESSPLHWEGQGGGSVGEATTIPFLYIYYIGAALVLLHILFQLAWLVWTKRRSTFIAADEDMHIYETTFSTPFSFGRNIFLPAALDSQTHRYVLMHEQSHVRHRHFGMLCLMEVMVAAQWFNPFVWLLTNELKLQQEMQVDADMMQAGVERKAYQLSLLDVASNSGRWVLMQTAFGSSPLKFRILFMNKTLNARSVRRRLIGGVAASLLLMTVFTFVACQLNPRAPKSPLDGVWTMEWIRNTDASWEQYPFRKHIKFCGNDWLMVVSYGAKDGHSIDFSFSGEQQAFRNDTIYNRKGKPAHYEFLDGGDRHICVWERDSFMNAGVEGPSITEQWVRCERDADLDYVLHHLASANKQAHGWRFAGVWEYMSDNTDPDAHEYLILTDEMMYYLQYFEHDHEGTYCAGSCLSQVLKRTSDTDFPFVYHSNAHIDPISTDSIDLTITQKGRKPEVSHWVRTTLPQRFLLLLSSTEP